MKIKVIENQKVCCPYNDDGKCIHKIRCIRMRNQECRCYHNNELLIKADIKVVITPSMARNDKGKKKYLRRVKNG